jgi:hypothetical protein
MGLLNNLTERLTARLIESRYERLVEGAKKEVEVAQGLAPAAAFDGFKKLERITAETLKRVKGFTPNSIVIIADELVQQFKGKDPKLRDEYARALADAVRELVNQNAALAPLFTEEWGKTIERMNSYLDGESLEKAGELQFFLEETALSYDWDRGIKKEEGRIRNDVSEWLRERLKELALSAPPEFAKGYLEGALSYTIDDFPTLASFAVSENQELGRLAVEAIEKNLSLIKPSRESLLNLAKALEQNGRRETYARLAEGAVGEYLGLKTAVREIGR